MRLLEDWAKYLRPGGSTTGDETIEAARNIRDLISTAVNTKSKSVRQMQSKVPMHALRAIAARLRAQPPSRHSCPNKRYHAISTRCDSQVIATDSIQHLLSVGFQRQDPAPFEALQILCYRNPQTATTIVREGGLQVLRELMTSEAENLELVNAICFLLSAMVAFNE